MAWAVETILKGAGQNAHYQFIAQIKALAESVGWVTLRYDTSTENHEWIAKSTGLSGDEEIYIGLKTYQNQAADYYNITAATFIGYVAENAFNRQPGYKGSGVPAHNNAITYFTSVNKQRVVCCLKVGTPVYTHFYIGKIFPYARPSEYPLPLLCAGMFDDEENKRFSDQSYMMPYYGYVFDYNKVNMFLRNHDGNYKKPWCNVWSTRGSIGNVIASRSYHKHAPAGEYYQIEPLILAETTPNNKQNYEPVNIWGELDGVYFCSGFNNNSENVIQFGGNSVVNQTGMTVKQAVEAIKAVNGRAFVMCQDMHRTAWHNYVAIEME